MAIPGRLGDLTVKQTETRKEDVVDALNKCAAETRWRRNSYPAWFELKGGMSEYVLGYPKMSRNIRGCTTTFPVYTEFTEQSLQTVLDLLQKTVKYETCMHASSIRTAIPLKTLFRVRCSMYLDIPGYTGIYWYIPSRQSVWSADCFFTFDNRIPCTMCGRYMHAYSI